MTSHEPAYDTSARLDGRRVHHWRRRTESTESGSMAQLVKRWLGVAWSQQQDFSLGWGPNADDERGARGASEITCYVSR